MGSTIDIVDLRWSTTRGRLTAVCQWDIDAELAALAGRSFIRLGSHVRDASGQLLIRDSGLRSDPVLPVSARHIVHVPIQIPSQPGVYEVEIDAVVEFHFWESDLRGRGKILRVEQQESGNLIWHHPQLGASTVLPQDDDPCEGSSTSGAGTSSQGVKRTAAERSSFFRLSKAFTPNVVAETDYGLFFVNTSDSVIGFHLFVYGSFTDVAELDAVLRVLETLDQAPQPGSTFLDVGANIGSTCIAAVRRFGFAHAIAFEPDPSNYLLLAQNVLANGLQDRIRVHQVALTDAQREVILELSPDNFGDHRLRVGKNIPPDPTLERYNESTRQHVTVTATSLDSLLEQDEFTMENVGLCWIDTQGHEGHVLHGATRILNTPIPVVIEYWPYGLARAGGLALLEDLIAAHYTHFMRVGDTDHQGPGRLEETSSIKDLRDLYSGEQHTSILLLKL